jgi:hypothetical protein
MGKIHYYFFLICFRIRFGFTLAESPEESPENFGADSGYFQKIFMVDHRGKSYGPHYTSERIGPGIFSAPLKEGDTVGLLWNDERLVVLSGYCIGMEGGWREGGWREDGGRTEGGRRDCIGMEEGRGRGGRRGRRRT